MTKKIFLFSLFLLFSVVQGTLYAQTCSCAGAPLLGSQSYGTTESGNFVIGLTHEYNDISSLYAGSDILDDNSTTRATNSTLLEINYGITRRLSISGTFSYVFKNRITGRQTGNPTAVTTRGIGDGMLLLKYVLKESSLASQYQLALGGGVKAPFGTTDIRLNGFLMNADMQPGSGAWDAVLWSYFSASFVPHTDFSIYGVNTYRRTGTNDRFGENDRYRFGNEWVSVLGTGNSITEDLGYSVAVQFRHTIRDQRNEQEMPNTGGSWLMVNPGISYNMTDRLSFRVSGKIPVYQHLQGTQPTTSYALSFSTFFSFNKSSEFIRF